MLRPTSVVRSFYSILRLAIPRGVSVCSVGILAGFLPLWWHRLQPVLFSVSNPKTQLEGDSYALSHSTGPQVLVSFHLRRWPPIPSRHPNRPPPPPTPPPTPHPQPPS